MNEPKLLDTTMFPTENAKKTKCGRYYVDARPMTMGRLVLLKRIKLAWGVFTGRYDALRWIGQEGEER